MIRKIYIKSVTIEYLLTEYLPKYPRHPHSLHLYIPQSLVNFKNASKKLRLLDLRILPIFLQEGQFEVSGKVL